MSDPKLNMIPEYTSPELSQRMLDAQFPLNGDSFYSKLGKGHMDDYMPCWRQDTLERWLMTQGFFSRRAATIQIAYRATQVDGRYVGRYYVTAFNGAGKVIGQGIADKIVSALGEIVVQVLTVVDAEGLEKQCEKGKEDIQ